MALLKLTEKSVLRLKANPKGRQTLYWDVNMQGFGVLVSGDSAVKTYVVKGNVRGHSIRQKIERVDLITLSKARQRAREMKVKFSGGIDPRAAKTSGDGVTLREALDAYLNLKNIKPRSKEGLRAIVERHLKDWLDLSLWSITRDMVEQRHKAIAKEVEHCHRAKMAEEAKRHLQRAERTEGHWPEAAARHRAKYEAAKERKPYSGHASANGAMIALRTIWNFIDDRTDDADDPRRNPVRLRGQWHTVRPRERIVKNDDLPKFYEAVMALENPIARDYILLMLFTGLRRRNETAALRWKEDIDLPGRIIHISAANTKSSRKLDLPMSDIVYRMLVARRAVGATDYVFHAMSTSGHIESPKFYFELIADATSIRVSPHDLRRTFLTIAESCDLSEFALKALVNHSLGRDVTAGYIQMTAERLREPVQRVADKIKQLCGVQEPHGENVARMPDRRLT